jgi:predicted deacylase
MSRLGRNRSGYGGETTDIAAVQNAMTAAATRHGWHAETLAHVGDDAVVAWHRMTATDHRRIYLSAGIHGDEPASPLAALELLQANVWPPRTGLWFCPCLNPGGFRLNRRESADGVDLNRDYLHPQTPEVCAHVAWLQRQPYFDAAICLHEDWEAAGFYLYELNPEQRPSPAKAIIAAVAAVCPIDISPLIEGRPAVHGIIRPHLDPATRPQWPEAFYLLQNKTRLSLTLEAPSDFPLATRVAALVRAVQASLAVFASAGAAGG